MLMISLFFFQFLPLVPRRFSTTTVPFLFLRQGTEIPSSRSSSMASSFTAFTRSNTSRSSTSGMHRHSSSTSSSSLDQDKRHPNHDHLSNNLTEFLAQSIIDSSLKNKQQFKLSFAIAGGGSKAISSLTSTPGASAVFRNADILYDRTSFCQYISHHLTSQTSLPPFIHKNSLDRMPLEHYYSFSSSSTSSSSSSFNSQTRKGQTKFGFASRGSAILLSQAALHHAFEQCWSLEDMLYHSVAVGCTSTLVSHGREDRSSRAHISLLRGDGRGVLWDVQFSIGSCTNTSGEDEGYEKEGEEEGQNGENKRHHVENRIVPNRRSRWEEEEVLARLILLCVDQFASGDDPKKGERIGCQNVHLKDLLNRMGDEWQESTFSVAVASSSPATRVEYAAQKILDDNYKKGDILQEKYENRTDAIVLVPSYNGGSSTLSGSCSNPLSMVPLIHTVLPPDPLILPGSFNPPHMGHVALANAAIRAMTRKKNMELGLVAGKESDGGSNNGECQDDNHNENDNDNDLYYNGDSHGKDDMSFILDSMWSTTENQLFQQQIQLNKDDNGQGPFPVLFEMSLTNADKPPMESQEASRRVSLFGDLVQEMNAVVEDTVGEKEEATERSSDSSTAKGSEQVCTSMPKDWGVLLTNAPLFREKVRVLQKYLAPSGGGGSGMKNGRKMTFVIGTDTMVRILHPKYYGDLMENVIKSLREMKREGVHFVVGGRLEQIKNPDGTLSKEAKFVTGEQELKHLPADVVDMFTMIQEKDFRVDISSTELRAKKQSGLSK